MKLLILLLSLNCLAITKQEMKDRLKAVKHKQAYQVLKKYTHPNIFLKEVEEGLLLDELLIVEAESERMEQKIIAKKGAKQSLNISIKKVISGKSTRIDQDEVIKDMAKRIYGDVK